MQVKIQKKNVGRISLQTATNGRYICLGEWCRGSNPRLPVTARRRNQLRYIVKSQPKHNSRHFIVDHLNPQHNVTRFMSVQSYSIHAWIHNSSGNMNWNLNLNSCFWIHSLEITILQCQLMTPSPPPPADLPMLVLRRELQEARNAKNMQIYSTSAKKDDDLVQN